MTEPHLNGIFEWMPITRRRPDTVPLTSHLGHYLNQDQRESRRIDTVGLWSSATTSRLSRRSRTAVPLLVQVGIEPLRHK